jgi:hypothetical protein
MSIGYTNLAMQNGYPSEIYNFFVNEKYFTFQSVLHLAVQTTGQRMYQLR